MVNDNYETDFLCVGLCDYGYRRSAVAVDAVGSIAIHTVVADEQGAAHEGAYASAATISNRIAGNHGIGRRAAYGDAIHQIAGGVAGDR